MKKKLQDYGGMGFEYFNENDEYLVKSMTERKYFTKLSEAKKYYDSLNESKAIWYSGIKAELIDAKIEY